MKKLSKLSIFGYGAGDAANNLAFTTATMFLLVYYTDVAGISAAAAGTLLLVVRIFDAFADVFAGRMVDRTFSKRFGKFRPFIMFGSIPLLLLSVATFSVPQLGESGTLLYAYVTYAALGLAYSLVNIPYGSLAGAMTQDPSERAKLGSARMVGALLVGSALGIFVAPLIKPGAKLQETFTTITLIFVVIGAALYFFTIFTAKERVHRSVPNVSFKQSMETLKTNRPLLWLCLSSFLFLTGYMALSSVQLYYLRDVLGRLDLYPVLSIAQLILTFVLAPAMPKLVRKFGKKTVYIAAGFICVVGGAIVFFSPAWMVWLGFSGLLVSIVGVMAINIVVWALEADTVEYGEWKTGVRTEGITYALFSFTRKTGQAVGGALAAYALAMGGYKSGAAQTAEAVAGIQFAAGALPAIMTILAIMVMSKYKLTDVFHAQIVGEIKARRELAEAEAKGDGGAGQAPAVELPATDGARPVAAGANQASS
ncbi:glucuronide transporter [Arthrobacter cavernae]|uniref:Glucuronide transporter n=1 Tax=Arthrobacter cavernae TaxID=2817681 RepID=A0A939HF84_9MICC|nr:glucuronide transporter [Arthrobacter cavernae]MBO1268099.1 glucuronide transporter [Arthrobacter cavernae]